MKILLDVNVVVDILGATEDMFYSLQALDVMLLRRFEPCVAVSEMPTIRYVTTARTYRPRAGALDGLRSLSEIVSVLDVTETDFLNAMDADGPDFEDAMIACTARRHGVDLIVTRNPRDYRNSPVAAVTPQQFCDTYRPDNYVYDMVEMD